MVTNILNLQHIGLRNRAQRFHLNPTDTIKESAEKSEPLISKHKMAHRLMEEVSGLSMDPTEAKFERRVRLARDTLSQLTQEDQDGLVKVLLDQVCFIHHVPIQKFKTHNSAHHPVYR